MRDGKMTYGSEETERKKCQEAINKQISGEHWK